MMVFAVSVALAGLDDPWEAATDRALVALGADVAAGASVDPRWEARALEEATSPGTFWARQLDGLRDRRAPELGDTAVVRPFAGLVEGDLVPVDRSGDREDGLLTARAGMDGSVYYGIAEARFRLRTGLDVIPGAVPSIAAEQWRIGVRGRWWAVALSQEARWFGPARVGPLLLGDAARPFPAVDAAVSTTSPVGRLSARALVGVLPGDRRDAARPGGLLLDLRWQPVPWIEAGVGRSSVFGGVGRPVDVGQVILPTRPHVYDDPDLSEPDTDERIALDARISAPVRRWLAPIDVIEGYVQHGGEDVIARELGPIPVPGIAGTGNVYGGRVIAGPWHAGVELAVLEDDLYRWYVGHRVYHDGWTIDGVPMGHWSGGDARTLSVRAGMTVTPGWSVEAGWDRTRRVLVVGIVDDATFVFSTPELRHRFAVRVAKLGARGSTLAADVAVAPVTGRRFVPGADAIEHRIGIAWTPGWTGRELRR